MSAFAAPRAFPGRTEIFPRQIARELKPQHTMKSSITTLIAILVLAAVQPARAAFDVFLKLDGVPGESTDARHANEIDVLSCSFKIDQAGINWAGGAASAAKANISPISLVKRYDSASPLLFIHSLLGSKLGKASIVFRKAGERPLEQVIITLTDVVVCNYSFGATPEDEQATEEFSLSFRAIKVRYVPQLPNGSAGTPIERTFDVVANRQLQ